MTTPQEDKPLDEMIASASDAVAKDEAAAEADRAPRPRRRAPAWLAVVATLAAVLAVYSLRNEFADRMPTFAEERAAAEGLVQYVRSEADVRRIRTGQYPATLAEIGLADVPARYAAAASGWSIAIPLSNGDSVRFAVVDSTPGGAK
jgi:hypothetical protein